MMKQSIKKLNNELQNIYPLPLRKRVSEARVKNKNLKCGLPRFAHNDAFTLAETLIALVIVGITAALVLPPIIINYQKEQTIVKLKKNYSTVSNAINKSISENGPLDTWDYSLERDVFAQKYILPYFNHYKKIANPVAKQRYVIKNKSGSTVTHSGVWNSYGTGISNWYDMPDGTSMGFGVSSYYLFPRVIITVDLNGVAKPNLAGRDVFYYAISQRTPRKFGMYNYSFVNPNPKTFNPNSTSREDAISECNGAGGYSGTSCGYIIMKDNWQISADYPW